MITESHFPTPVYIQEIPNAIELNHYLEKNILQWQKQDPKGVNKTNMWANINYPGGFNRPHLHPNSLFSGVYWIKAPEKSGDLMLYEPRPGVHTTMPNRKEGKLPPELWREIHYKPQAGVAIMFPSWLWHEVKHNESNDTRISVSFNFLQR